MGNYNNIRGAGRSVYVYESTGKSLLDEGGIRINECYPDNSGNLVITYNSHKRSETVKLILNSKVQMNIERSVRIDDPDSHWLEVPMKATSKWNEFVDGLPKWADVDQ